MNFKKNLAGAVLDGDFKETYRIYKRHFSQKNRLKMLNDFVLEISNATENVNVNDEVMMCINWLYIEGSFRMIKRLIEKGEYQEASRHFDADAGYLSTYNLDELLGILSGVTNIWALHLYEDVRKLLIQREPLSSLIEKNYGEAFKNAFEGNFIEVFDWLHTASDYNCSDKVIDDIIRIFPVSYQGKVALSYLRTWFKISNLTLADPGDFMKLDGAAYGTKSMRDINTIAFARFNPAEDHKIIRHYVSAVMAEHNETKRYVMSQLNF